MDNLKIQHVEVRCEDDPDVSQYAHLRQMEIVKCDSGPMQARIALRSLINRVINNPLKRLTTYGVANDLDLESLNNFTLNEAER